MKAKRSPNLQNSLKSSDICRIIETCKTSGVHDFQLGNLHIKFGEPVVEPLKWPTDIVPPVDTPTTDQDTQSARKLSEEQLADLIVSDPVAYEKLETSGET